MRTKTMCLFLLLISTSCVFGQIQYHEGKWGLGNPSVGWYKLATFDLSNTNYNSIIVDAEVNYTRTYEYGYNASANIFIRKVTSDNYGGKWNYTIEGTEIGDLIKCKKIDATTYELYAYSSGNHGHVSVRLAITSEQTVMVTIPSSVTQVSNPDSYTDVPKIGKSASFIDNVGIGTTSPDSKLTVKGKIHAEEVKVDLLVPGPDYVFKEDYDLKSLEEVQNYIKEHGHLPNIPSAVEMEANGIQLGEMNMKLLEKIEELTLYALEQQERIQEFKRQLEGKNSQANAIKEELKVQRSEIEQLKKLIKNNWK
ncbi:hypothetical protein [Flagellimonas sp. 2504JD4-2]